MFAFQEISGHRPPYLVMRASIRLAIDEHRNGRVREQLDGFAAEHQCGNAASTVRRHHDQVASIPFRRVDNGLIRLFVLGVNEAAIHTGRRGGILDLIKVFFGCPIRLSRIRKNLRRNCYRYPGHLSAH